MKSCIRSIAILILLLYGMVTLYGDNRTNPIDTIRVMTYNIHTGVGVDGEFDLERIAQIITDHRIDIAGLQEVDQSVERTDRVMTMQELSNLTGMNYAFGKAIEFQGGEYGNGILSRFPILKKHNHPYTFEQTGEHRSLLYVLLEYNRDTLFVMNTHLDHRPDDAERLMSAEEILSVSYQHKDRPALLLGDINDVPKSDVISRLKEYFHDAWEYAGEGTGYTFHTEDLNRRIDYIFYADSSVGDETGFFFKPIRAYTIQTPASDHLPVITEFEVRMRQDNKNPGNSHSILKYRDEPTLSIEPDQALAGSYQNINFKFTAGRDTLKPGGGFRIEIPSGYGETADFLWDRPQSESQELLGYVQAISDNVAEIQKKLYGVAGGIIQCDVMDSILLPGESIYLTYSGRVQNLARKTAIRAQWRASDQSYWKPINKEPIIYIKPRQATTMVITAPADVARGENFNAAVGLLDTYGNRAYKYRGTVEITYTDPEIIMPVNYTFTQADSGLYVIRDISYGNTGFQKITATDGRLTGWTHYTFVWENNPQLRRYFGDTHFHTGTGTGNTGFRERWADNRGGDHRGNFTTQREAYRYIRDVARLDFASASEHDDEVFDSLAWNTSKRIADSFYTPGRFTTFYAYEWTATGEHHVVLFKDRESEHFHSHTHPTLDALWNALDEQGKPALTIPHLMWPFADHTMWNEINNRYRKIGEIYSLWNNRFLLPPNDEPHRFELGIDNPWSYQYAWHRGHKIGLIGSSDNHLGQPGSNAYTIHTRHAGGLAAVLARQNTREDLWHSFSHRRTYATTGTRIYLHFTADGNHMGSTYETEDPPVFDIRVGGTDEIKSVELIKYNGEEYIVIYTDHPGSDISEFTFTDYDFSNDSMYYVRVIQADNYPGRTYADPAPDIAWSSPIWIKYISE